MGYEMPQKTPKNPINKDKSDSQLHIFSLVEAMKEIDREYPNAKINPTLIEGDEIHGYTVKGRPLKEYAKEMHELYEGNDNTDMYHH